MVNRAVDGPLFKMHFNQMITQCLYNPFLQNELVELVQLVLAIYSVHT